MLIGAYEFLKYHGGYIYACFSIKWIEEVRR